MDLAPAAAQVRGRFNQAQTVTYLVDRNVNYTNVCVARCNFCAFYRPEGHPEAYVLSNELIYEKMQVLPGKRGGELRFFCRAS